LSQSDVRYRPGTLLYTSYNTHNSPTTKKYPVQNVSPVEVERSDLIHGRNPLTTLGSAGLSPMRFLTVRGVSPTSLT
jgi:hypothetical protein